MSTELERRLRDALARLPESSGDARRRARAAALATLPAERRRTSGWLLLVTVTVTAVLGTAAALAASGKLHVELGARRSQPRIVVPTRLDVPQGSHGIAVAAGGRVWLATRRGFRIEGMNASAVELSPRALYAVVGLGRSLVAIAPRRHPWTQETAGRVVAAAWSPDGLKIAYVVARRGRNELRLIEGDGDHDRLVDPRVAALKPSWRADSLAVAYVTAGGQARVYDLGSGRRRTFETRRCGGPAQAVAYAPAARRLAVAGRSGVAVVGRWNRPPGCVTFERVLTMDALAWLPDGGVVTTDHPAQGFAAHSAIRRFRWRGAGAPAARGAAYSADALRALASAPVGSLLAVAVEPVRGTLQIRVAPPPPLGSAGMLSHGRLILRVRVPAGPVSLSWR